MSEATKTKQDLIGFQETASSAQDGLDVFIKAAESDAVEATSLLAAKHCQIDELLLTS
jgi:hypothetical protein